MYPHKICIYTNILIQTSMYVSKHIKALHNTDVLACHVCLNAATIIQIYISASLGSAWWR